MVAPTYPVLPGLTYPVLRSPIWDTVTEVAISGKRNAYQNRTMPLYRYELIYEFLRADAGLIEWQTLMGFFNQVRGRARMFRFHDNDDGVATLEPFGSGDGASLTFQLTRAGSFGFAESVFAPLTVTQVRVAGVVKATPGDYSVDMNTGIVTFVAAPALAAALDWTGTYDWYCRFDQDMAEFSKFAQNFFEAKKISFSTESL